MKKLIGVSILIIVVVLAIAILPLLLWQTIDYKKSISFGEFIYYATIIVMMFATVAAVIVGRRAVYLVFQAICDYRIEYR